MSNIIDKIQLSGITYDIVGGGGKAIEAGRGISVTTGETADTVSFDLAISAGTGSNSIAEGHQTSATSISSHAEGYNTIASGSYSHAEGYDTIARGQSSHAEGGNNTASGRYSHAEGQHTIASGSYSHAEGEYSKANGRNSHAEGDNTIANNQSEHASGYWNISNTGSTDADKTLFSVGNGAWDDTLQETVRHNAFEIRYNGDIYLTKDGQDVKLQDQLGGSIEVSSAVTSGDTNPVQGGALWDELRIPKNEEVETVLEWENNDEGITTNYPSGVATKLEFYVDESQMTENGYAFWKTDWEELGNIGIVVSNGNISVTSYENVTYSISGNVVTVEYPTIAAEVTKIYSYYDQFWTVKAYTGGIVYEPIIDQVSANTTALANKQDTLIAGTNITISGNVISAQGGGQTYTAGDGINISNDVISVTGKVATSAVTTALTSSSTDAQVPSAKCVYDQVGGLKLVKLTQSVYDALSPNYDSNTLYVING